MTPNRTGLLSPMNLAAYVAWAAIGYELLLTGWSPPPWRDGPAPPWVLGAMHVGFVVLFAAVTTRGDGEAQWRCRGLLLAQVGLAVAMMLLARSSTLPILMILCAIQIVYLWRPRAAAALILAINVGMYLIYRFVWEVQAPAISTVLNASFQAFAALTAWFAMSAEKARDELAAANADLLATRALLAESARDGERLRLSRELHDVAGHKLTALKLNLAALARDARFAADEQVGLCARLADELLADIRGVVAQMRQADGVELGEALALLATPFPRPRMHLDIADGVRVGSVAQAEAVLRAVQEGLTNAVRHSQAQNLWVVLRREAGALRLDIRDDGRGHGELRVGNGLCGMRERLEAVGGRLDVRRTDTGGVHLEAWLPT